MCRHDIRCHLHYQTLTAFVLVTASTHSLRPAFVPRARSIPASGLGLYWLAVKILWLHGLHAVAARPSGLLLVLDGLLPDLLGLLLRIFLTACFWAMPSGHLNPVFWATSRLFCSSASFLHPVLVFLWPFSALPRFCHPEAFPSQVFLPNCDAASSTPTCTRPT